MDKDTVKYLTDAMAEKLGPMIAEKIAESRAKGEERAEKAGVSPDELVRQDLMAQDAKQLTGEMAIARMARYMFNAKAHGTPIHKQINDAQDRVCAKMFVGKVMGEDVLSTGGALVMPEVAQDVIPILFDMSTVRASGATQLPMPSGNLSMPYGNAAGTVQYDGESDPITESSPTTGQISMVARKLTGTVGVSNELLQDSSGRSDRFIRDQLVGAMAEKEDVTFLRSVGASNEPKGLRYFAVDQSQSINSESSYTTATVTDELADAVYQVEQNKIAITSGGWILHPRSLKFLRSARDGNNNLVWGAELAGGTLAGFPFKKTTQIPITLNDVGSGSDESEVYFANFSDFVIGDTEMLSLAMSAEATYYTGSAYVSAFARNESVFRAISRHDTACRFRGQEAAIILGVRWSL